MDEDWIYSAFISKIKTFSEGECKSLLEAILNREAWNFTHAEIHRGIRKSSGYMNKEMDFTREIFDQLADELYNNGQFGTTLFFERMEIGDKRNYELWFSIKNKTADGKPSRHFTLSWNDKTTFSEEHKFYENNPPDAIAPIRQKMIDESKLVYNAVAPEYGFCGGGMSFQWALEDDPYGRDDMTNFFGKYFMWLNFIGPNEIPKFGMKKLLETPLMSKIEKLPDGGALLINSVSEMDPRLRKYFGKT